MSIGEALKNHREQSKWTQDDVGAALGVTRVMVSHWEQDKRIPSERQAAALGYLYGIDPQLMIAAVRYCRGY